MRIAITAETAAGLDAPVAVHFGQAPHFVFVEVSDGNITQAETLPNPLREGHRPGEVPALISEHCATAIISGGMGLRAIRLFGHHDITAVTGASGTVRTAVASYLAGALAGAAPCADSMEHHGGTGSAE